MTPPRPYVIQIRWRTRRRNMRWGPPTGHWVRWIDWELAFGAKERDGLLSSLTRKFGDARVKPRTKR